MKLLSHIMVTLSKKRNLKHVLYSYNFPFFMNTLTNCKRNSNTYHTDIFMAKYKKTFFHQVIKYSGLEVVILYMWYIFCEHVKQSGYQGDT